MRHTYLSEAEAQIAFAKDAADHFSSHPEHSTFTDGEIKEGVLFAVRWGLMNDCVLVLKLDEYFTPIVYGECIKRTAP